MKKYVTEIKAIDPIDGEMKSWQGPDVPGISFQDARNYCQKNGLGYCEVIGELMCRGDFNTLEIEEDYHTSQLN